MKNTTKPAHPEAMPKAVIYARYSSHSQTEQSIEGQLRVTHEFAKREGLMVVGEYIDRAISGKTDERPDFQRMITDAKKRQFQFVIVYKLDRFARNRYDSAMYRHKLKECGVKVLSAMENIGDNPESVIMEGMLESMAEYYSLNLSVNVKRGMQQSAINGTYTGGRPPIGFKVIDKKVFIDEDKAPIIRFAFEEYAKGVSKREIVRQLNEKGIRNENGKPLTLTSFQSALKNRKYIGISEFDGVEYTSMYPVMIDPAIFEQVQERLAKVAYAPASAKAKQEYLLQGKAYCGMCGTLLVGNSGTSRTGDMHYYYTCGARKKLRNCKKKSERKGFLEWFVCEQTVEYVLIPERMEYIAERVVAEYEKEISSGAAKECERRIAKLDRDADKVFKRILETESDLSVKRYEQQLELFDLQKADLEIDLTKLRLACGVRYTKEEVTSWMKMFCKGDLMDEDFRRRIIDVFINSIYLYDNKLIIYYNIKGGKQVTFIDNLGVMDEMASEVDGENSGNDKGEVVRICNDLDNHLTPHKHWIFGVYGGFCFWWIN